MKTKLIMLSALSAVFAASSASGVTVVNYNLNDGTGLVQAPAVLSDAPDAVAATATASSITAKIGTNTGLGWGRDDTLNPDVNSDTSDDPGNLADNSNDLNTWWSRGSTLPDAFDPVNDPWVEWTVSADAHHMLDFTTGTVDLRYALHDRNQTGDYNSQVILYSVDQNAILSMTDLGTVDQNNRAYVYSTIGLDASGLGLVNAATLRLYFVDNSGSGSKHTLLDSIGVSAAITPTPEPATALLLGITAVAGVCTRRRRCVA